MTSVTIWSVVWSIQKSNPQSCPIFCYMYVCHILCYQLKGLIAILGLDSSNTNSKHPLKCNGDVSKNSLVNHPLRWRLWRLHVGTGICKIFTIVLQKLVSYLNIFQNKQSNSKHCQMSSDLQEILLLLTFRLA